MACLTVIPPRNYIHITILRHNGVDRPLWTKHGELLVGETILWDSKRGQNQENLDPDPSRW